jgi:quercetin dioxygenase-like cupin family protein
MQKCVAAIVIVFSSVVASIVPLAAQQDTAQPQAAPDPGVNPVRLLDRDEIRVTRVELAPGAVRRAHSHDDVAYHVWVPVTGMLEITIEKGAATSAKPGQAFFMKKGTQHWFRNTGTTAAAVMEIFVKRSTTAADGHPMDEPAVALAMAGLPFPDR